MIFSILAACLTLAVFTLAQLPVLRYFFFVITRLSFLSILISSGEISFLACIKVLIRQLKLII
jgi:hypothetical protein